MGNINKGVLQVLAPRPTSCCDAVEITEHTIARETYSKNIVEEFLNKKSFTHKQGVLFDLGYSMTFEPRWPILQMTLQLDWSTS